MRIARRSWGIGRVCSRNSKWASLAYTKYNRTYTTLPDIDNVFEKLMGNPKIIELLNHSDAKPSEILNLIKTDTELLSTVAPLVNSFQTSIGSAAPAASTKPVRIAVTGGAGAIGYALLFRLASGSFLGPNTPIQIQCLELPQGLKAGGGVEMELKDSAFPLLRGISFTDSAEKAFEGAEYVFLVGAQPRVAGMERADLLKKNAAIFSAQGKALNNTADKNVKVLIVGNPANTNALIASVNAPKISPTQFSAMTRLDHNRGLAQLADKLNVTVNDITNFAIWGNHSDTQFPDVNSTLIKGSPAVQSLDAKWVSDTFIPTVATRGKAIIGARGASSAASAASAAIDQMRDWALGTNGKWTSMAVWTGSDSKTTPYGVSSDIYYSFPVVCSGGKYEIVKDVKINEDSKKRMKATDAELVAERNDAGDLAKRK
eukprot:TRINITY_DN850_c0_g1_i1.p1 TRINITY_DN850_c0_g1~~TRINITY_DN850_c0_g1_i1.p1  ORF type:complete len:430 (+),score=118.88 TRINITY_DN850_c0_g1_i1:75-1364(+)